MCICMTLWIRRMAACTDTDTCTGIIIVICLLLCILIHLCKLYYRLGIYRDSTVYIVLYQMMFILVKLL